MASTNTTNDITKNTNNCDQLYRFLRNKLPPPFLENNNDGKIPSLSDWFFKGEESKSSEWLETSHDYIQWLFPIDTASQSVPDAPRLPWSNVVDLSKEFEKWTRNEALLFNLLCSTHIMLYFFGFRIANMETFLKECYFSSPYSGSPFQSEISVFIRNLLTCMIDYDFDRNNKAFINLVNHPHNDLRITRIIKCWRLFGFPNVAINLIRHFKFVLESAKMVRVANSPNVSHIDEEFGHCINDLMNGDGFDLCRRANVLIAVAEKFEPELEFVQARFENIWMQT